MKDQLAADRDFNLWVLLHQVSDIIFKAREKELSQYGVTTMQAGVLFVIEAVGGKATPGEISRWLLREPHTISSLLTRMERGGLVSKSIGKRRTLGVTLTAKGRQAFSQSMKRESIREILSCLSEEEHRQLGSSLEKLRDRALQKLTTVMEVPFP